jgi:uncharacterized membrane protein YqaE (UPF0057 family)
MDSSLPTTATATATATATVALPKPRKRITIGLVVLTIFVPFLAIYLDGASKNTILLNFVLWIGVFPPFATIHAIVFLCRDRKHREMSRPMRTRLWSKNKHGSQPLNAAHESPNPAHASPAPPMKMSTLPRPYSALSSRASPVAPETHAGHAAAPLDKIDVKPLRDQDA